MTTPAAQNGHKLRIIVFFFNWVHVYGITRISFLVSKVIHFPPSEPKGQAAYTDVRLTGHWGIMGGHGIKRFGVEHADLSSVKSKNGS